MSAPNSPILVDSESERSASPAPSPAPRRHRKRRAQRHDTSIGDKKVRSAITAIRRGFHANEQALIESQHETAQALLSVDDLQEELQLSKLDNGILHNLVDGLSQELADVKQDLEEARDECVALRSMTATLSERSLKVSYLQYDLFEAQERIKELEALLSAAPPVSPPLSPVLFDSSPSSPSPHFDAALYPDTAFLCRGCLGDAGGQEEHMGLGGCMASRPNSPHRLPTPPYTPVEADNEVPESPLPPSPDIELEDETEEEAAPAPAPAPSFSSSSGAPPTSRLLQGATAGYHVATPFGGLVKGGCGICDRLGPRCAKCEKAVCKPTTVCIPDTPPTE